MLSGGNVCYAGLQQGFIEYYSPANPAAGANLNWQPPAGWAYRFFTVWFQLANSAAVANRAVQIEWSSGSNIIWRTGVANANFQAANLHWAYCLYTTCGDVETRRTITGLTPTECVSLPLGEMILLGGGGAYVATNIANLQAADQLQAITFGFQRWRI